MSQLQVEGSPRAVAEPRHPFLSRSKMGLLGIVLFLASKQVLEHVRNFFAPKFDLSSCRF